MPRITIHEKENEVMRLLNPTENTVLIPLVCKAGTPVEAKLFKAAELSKFKSIFRNQVVSESFEEEGLRDFADGIPERSFEYTEMLLSLGLNVVIKPIISEASAEALTEEELEEIVNAAISNGAFDEFKDKNIFNLKFITSGAHANMLTRGNLSGCYDKLTKIANDRLDCVAILELESDLVCEVNNISDRDIKNVLSGEDFSDEKYKYAVCVFPWGYYKGSSIESLIKMPGGFGYLSAFANSIQTNANWYAAAGVNRGVVPGLDHLCCEVGESQMHILLNDLDDGESSEKIRLNVNPIMRVSEYGDKVWGNKVAWVNRVSESYQSYLNVRLLLCDIKKQIYYAATRVTFEPNDMITWLNFQQLANQLLDEMQSNRGIEWYSWRRQATDKKATIKAILTIKPIEAVEYFDITVSLTSEEAAVTEI